MGEAGASLLGVVGVYDDEAAGVKGVARVAREATSENSVLLS